MKIIMRFILLGLFFCAGFNYSFAQISMQKGAQLLSAQEILEFHKFIDSKSAQTQSLQGNFTQLKHFDFSDKKLDSKGRLYFKKDNKIRWEYLSPESNFLIFSDNKIGSKNQGKQLINISKMPIIKEMGSLIQSFSQGSKMFDPSISEVKYYLHNEGYLVILKPKDKRAARFIESVEMIFDKKEGWANKIRIIQENKDYTDIIFTQMNRNQNLSENLFTLQ